jgi:hypothetical protein
MEHIMKKYITMEEFHELMEQDVWINAFKNARRSYNPKTGKHSEYYTGLYRDDISDCCVDYWGVSEEMMSLATDHYKRRRNEIFTHIAENTQNAFFVGMGMKHKLTDIENYRVRSNVLMSNGKIGFIEFSSTNQIFEGRIEGLPYMMVDACIHDGEYQNIRSYNDCAPPIFSKKAVLNATNSFMGTKFTSVEVIQYFVNYEEYTSGGVSCLK